MIIRKIHSNPSVITNMINFLADTRELLMESIIDPLAYPEEEEEEETLWLNNSNETFSNYTTSISTNYTVSISPSTYKPRRTTLSEEEQEARFMKGVSNYF
ncbi:unnamed protein product [Didymodactylos carnosus]|uniref:Uncharacterized protein n=1 Tax=Didymodactylos carnosus TaxID=1234261 RepID=A0A814XRV5_9BILA|nr:unnamed protein product [Didymodactylos carnosus]CAF1472205.1 unnamed protein product [Didymodactylos carnosus]CAF3983160.1 unnamed protein product [Didymodactylos carnosus]CAF4263906.1 unnamed protein product [Didymodactylos carnosus]